METTSDKATLLSMHPSNSSLLWTGILSSLAGIIALSFPMITSLSVGLLMGATFLVAGISGVVGSFSLKFACGFWPVLLYGLFSALFGLLVLVNPFAGLVALTVLIGAGLLANGAFEIYLGLQLRPEGAWLMMILSGLLAVVVSVLIIFNLATSSMVLVGTLVGFNFLFSGIAYLTLWSAVRRVVPEGAA